MKWALMGVLAFGLSTAAATGFVAMQSAEETPVNADSTAVQDTSLTVDETPIHDEPQPEQMDSTAAVADTVGTNDANENLPSATSDSLTDAECPVVEECPLPAISVPEPEEPDPEVQRQASRQVARILSNMRDQDMAQVLSELEDDEVEMILRNVTARDAARILSQLSGERAARLSRRLLVVSPTSGSNNR